MKPTAIQALIHQEQARPKNAAFLFHGEAWTYEKIASQSESLTHGMVARGVKPGDRVARDTTSSLQDSRASHGARCNASQCAEQGRSEGAADDGHKC
jgi:hypothetical protein